MPNHKPCGTPAGYAQHLKRAERPCAECLPGSVTYTDIEIARQIETFRERRGERRLWESHGILRVTYEQIFATQDRTCGCCKTTDPKQGWCVDLDNTGKIRGILCSDCNLGLSSLGDDLISLQRAVAYLETHAMRDGHPRHHGPVDIAVRPAPSARMEVCFQHFTAGLSINEVVVQEKLTPDVVKEIHTLWQGPCAEAKAP